MPQPRSRRHHTVPRFHLKGFANEKNQLAQVDVTTGRRALVSVNDASVVNDFYNVLLDDGSHSDEWETWLAQIEGAAAPAIRRAIDSLIWWPNAQERHDIATWAAAQFLRGTGHRRFQERHKALAMSMQVGMGGIEYLRHVMQNGIGRPITDEEVETVWADITGSEAVWTVTAREHVYSLGRTIDTATRLLHDRGWHRVQFSRLNLAINDTPLALVRDENHLEFMGVGLSNAGFVTVALNRNTMLWMSAIGDKDFDMPPSVKLAKVHNESVLFNADRFVYFHPDDDPLPDRPLPRPPREILTVSSPDMANRDRPLIDVLDQIESHDYDDRDSMIADYEWPLDGYVPPIDLNPDLSPVSEEPSPVD